MEQYKADFKRKEVKYLLDSSQKTALMSILESRMEPDAFPHSSISNLYYDTPDFRMVRRSLEKPQYKEKLRLRCYCTPEDNSPAFPEIKKKTQGIVYKRRVCMPYADALAYLAGDNVHPSGQIFRELDWLLCAYPDLAPRVFLSYERDSWKGLEDPELRLTMDSEILWRAYGLDLRQGPWGDSLLLPGQTLMEIKFPGAAPLWLSRALSDIGAFPVSFSKYGRAYEILYKENQKKTELRKYA